MRGIVLRKSRYTGSYSDSPHGVPIAKDRCEGYGSNHQRCIRNVGHSGRHVTSKEFRR